MNKVKEIFTQLQSTNSKLEKQKIINDYHSFLNFAFNTIISLWDIIASEFYVVLSSKLNQVFLADALCSIHL